MNELERLKAQNAVLREALERIESHATQPWAGWCSKALASTPESSLADIRRAERERIIALYSPDDSANDFFDKIRQMED